MRVRFLVVPYVLELECITGGTGYYKRVPLPGSMHVAVDRRVFVTAEVGEALRSILRGVINHAAFSNTLSMLQQNLSDTLYVAAVEGVALVADKLPEIMLGRIRFAECLEPEPEYFSVAGIKKYLANSPFIGLRA